ncbi:DUF928 domain-containing protein [Phormidium tenue FACHB-886]|nr:DUF928 domain-containing protein [Phormidium tenue FACHB-886]
MKIKSTYLFLILIAFNSLFFTTQVRVNSAHANPSSNSQSLIFNTSSTASPSDFSGSGRPRYRTSGGSRGICLSQLVALIPGIEGVDLQEGCDTRSVTLPTLTLDDTPTFWFYIPQLSRANISAEWVLLDEKQLPIQTERIILTETPGIISLSPTQPLETNRSYAWVFSILANPQSPSQNPKVEGIIQRIEPNVSLQTQLQQNLSQLEKVAIYANRGIWHDALTALAEQRLTTPSDETLNSQWVDFLNSVGLEAIANAPLLDCCVSSTPTND